MSAANRRQSIHGILVLLGIFAGLCTVFALVATVAQAVEDRSQSQWPQVTASVEKCVMYPRSFGHPGYYYADCRFIYVVAGERIRTELASRYVTTPEIWEYPRRNLYGQFEEWVDQHPPGTAIVLRYNPARPQKAKVVATDTPFGGPHTPDNLKVLKFFAASCLGLFVIARIVRPPRLHDNDAKPN